MLGLSLKRERDFFFWRLVRGRNAQNHCDHWHCTWTKIWEQIVLGGWLDMCMLSNNITYFQFLYSLFFLNSGWNNWRCLMPDFPGLFWFAGTFLPCADACSHFHSTFPGAQCGWMAVMHTRQAKDCWTSFPRPPECLSFMNSWEAPVSEVVALETTLNFNNNYFM